MTYTNFQTPKYFIQYVTNIGKTYTWEQMHAICMYVYINVCLFVFMKSAIMRSIQIYHGAEWSMISISQHKRDDNPRSVVFDVSII